MNSPFNRQHVRGDINQSKLSIAKKLILKIVGKLGERDRLGLITFNTVSTELQPLLHLTADRKGDIQTRLTHMHANGGTNMSAGVKTSSHAFDGIELSNEYENRILFLTDAQTNTGELSVDCFRSEVQRNAQRRVYTTFVGIGVDLQTSLIHEITNTRGANYFTVHDEESFCLLLDQDFDLMVTPLVFNLQLTLESDHFQIEHVFGSPSYADSTDQLMRINTLFPSRSQNDGKATRGGIVLLKLMRKQSTSEASPHLRLTMTYEDRRGSLAEEKASVHYPCPLTELDYFGDKAIRKAVLLTHYVTLLKTWIRNERSCLYNHRSLDSRIVGEDKGWLYKSKQDTRDTWERQNTPLQVSNVFRQILANFKEHFEKETLRLEDDDLKQEITIMNKLIAHEQ